MVRSREEKPARNMNMSSGKTAGLLLLVFPILLIAFAACGSDNRASAQSVEVSGETLKWSPQWESGDTRSVTLSGDILLSPELQTMIDSFEQALDADLQDEFDSAADQTVVSSIRFVSVSETGAIVRYDIPLESLVDALTASDFENDDAQMLSGMVGLLGQLDLAVEFSVDADGQIIEVTNIEELSETVSDLIDSLMALAAFADEESISPEDRAQMESFFSQLHESELVAELAAGAMQTATGQMFLMRAGEYTVGQPVTVSVDAASAVGVVAPAEITYLLKSVGDGTAVMDVTIDSAGVDIVDYMSTMVQELAGLAGADPDEAIEGLDSVDADTQEIIDEISEMIFQPYTVTLIIDTETGWVISADWSMEFTLPPGMIEQLEAIQEFGGEPTIDLEDIWAAVLINSSFGSVEN